MSIAVVVTTIDRPHAIQRFVTSVRQYFPEMPIYVADQSRQIGAMSSFYTDRKVHLIRMDYDAGLSASRNALVAAVSEEYFVLCDDDLVFGVKTRFDDAMLIFRTHPEIGVVGGTFREIDHELESVRHWEMFLHYDQRNRILALVPIYNLAPKVLQTGGIRFYLCDAVHNFAVFRKSMFSEWIRWDEQLKVNGEHEDFYLNMKLHSDYRVAYLPTMSVFHQPPFEYARYYRGLRSRTEGWRTLFAKWNLDQLIEMGAGVRSKTDLGAMISEKEARRRFFLNADLSFRRALVQPAGLEVHDSGRIAAVATLDQIGDPSRNGPPLARLHIGRDNGRLVALADPPLNSGLPTQQPDSATAMDRDNRSGETPAKPDRLAEPRHWRIFPRPGRHASLSLPDAPGLALAEPEADRRLPKRGRVTAVVTSCGRQDLLERTLDSVFRCNTFPLDKLIVVEDGPDEANAELAARYRDIDIDWLSTGTRVGQIAAIDLAYSTVDTEYIFHFEDDWQFYQPGFIEKSLIILERLPRCLQVWLRALNDTPNNPLASVVETVAGQAYRRLELGHTDRWHGFSFNPGLRRTADYQMLGSYGRYAKYDAAQEPAAHEITLAQIYRDAGFYAVILADNAGRGYVRHIGAGRRVI